MYKLLALDIDDTLLRRDLSLSPENKEAVQKAQENGVTVILCTGRAYPGAHKVCAMLGLDNLPVVTFGGAQINLYPSGEVLYQNIMPPSIVRDCISFARKHNVVMQCYEGDEFYYQDNSEESRFYEERLGYSGIRTELDTLHFTAVQKCIIISQPFMIDKLIPVAKKHFHGKAEVLRSYSRFLEFYNAGVSKGRAVAWLADYFGILQEEVIAMGDSDLDVSMIDYAGMGVGVANGSRAVLESANYVSPHADENAVAHVINKFILK